MSEVLEVAAVSAVDTQQDAVVEFVTRFTTYAQKSAVSIVRMGEVVCEARETLSDDDYIRFSQEVGIKSKSTLRKYERIGKQALVFNDHIELVPHNWTSVYSLSGLSVDHLREAFELRKIWSSMSGEEATELVLSYGDKKPHSISNKQSEAAEPEPDTSYRLSIQFASTPSSEFVRELQRLITELFVAHSAEFELALSELLDQIIHPVEQSAEGEA